MYVYANANAKFIGLEIFQSRGGCGRIVAVVNVTDVEQKKRITEPKKKRGGEKLKILVFMV